MHMAPPTEAPTNWQRMQPIYMKVLVQKLQHLLMREAHLKSSSQKTPLNR